MHLRVNMICIRHFCPQRKTIAAHCLLWDDFSDNIVIFNVYKWHHSDVIIIKLTAGTQNEIPVLLNVYFWFFLYSENWQNGAVKLLYRTTLTYLVKIWKSFVACFLVCIVYLQERKFGNLNILFCFLQLIWLLALKQMIRFVFKLLW